MPAVNRLLKAVVLMALVSVITVSASGARHVVPALKSNWRAGAVAMRARRPVKLQRSSAARAFDRGRKSVRAKLAVTAWLNALPRLVRGRPHKAPGADVFSAKLARLIWKVLGGHGRLGPGATI